MANQTSAGAIAPEAMPRMFHAMAKPVSSTCNLDCTYCYYLSKETLPGGPTTGRMSDEMLELFVQRYIAGVTGPEVVTLSNDFERMDLKSCGNRTFG